MTIAIVGATGNVGRALVDHLAAAGVVPRVVSRNPRATWRVPVDAVVGDLAEAATRDRLFAGATRAFLLSEVDAPEDRDRAVVEAVQRAGVRHVVKLSTIGVQSGSPIGKFHEARERWIEQAGLTWTFVRPGFFMSNVLQWLPQLRAGDRIAVPAADGAFAPISPRDIAEVAARALLDDGAAHHGQRYAVTGEALITAREQIAILARVLDRPLTCVAQGVDDAIAVARSRNLPPLLIEGLGQLWRGTEAGNMTFRTDTFRAVTGHAPESFETWARDRADAFR